MTGLCLNFSEAVPGAADFARQVLFTGLSGKDQRKIFWSLQKSLLDSTGYEEISLTSFSTSDYTGLEFNRRIIKRMEHRKVNLSLPSLRIDSFSLDLMEKAQKVRKSGLTFAPEAGTQRLRDVINKGVTEEDLLNSVTIAFNGGWSGVKLYFMVGLAYRNI